MFKYLEQTRLHKFAIEFKTTIEMSQNSDLDPIFPKNSRMA